VKRILVVEDDLDGRRMIQMALAEHGYRVVPAPNAETALAECLIANPDVILLDLHLPGMDGQQFLRWYRRQPGANARVIVVSGVTNADPLSKGLDVEEFIGKPFDIEHLLSSVYRAAYA
jgi:two-component system KDP operon response regulator KdpE